MLTAPVKANGVPIRERILGFGPPKSAKTTAYLTIARWYQDTGTPGTFYVVSTDLAYEAMLMDEEWEDLQNLQVFDVDPSDMGEIVKAAKAIKNKGKVEDWFSLDLVADAWRSASDEYAVISSKGSVSDVASLWKTSKDTSKYPIEGWEWGMPNARYRFVMNNCVRSFPGHVMCLTGQKELLQESGSGKTKEREIVKSTFSHLGFKPDAKADEESHRFHSILHFTGNKTRGFKIATAGDRFRYRRQMGKEMSSGGMWIGEDYEDFTVDYLVKVAGWKM